MAGFFGFFDYAKPGPGVAKKGPRKKSFVVFFEIYARKFWKLIVANLLYVLVSLPVVTNGLANAGLTFITRNFAREKHAFIPDDFFDTIRKNWKQALIVGLINLFVTGLIAFDVYFFINGKGTMNYIFMVLILTLALVFTFMKYYNYMLLITFKLSIRQIYKNSLIFAIAGIKQNFVIFLSLLLLYALGFLLCLFSIPVAVTVIVIVYIFLYPSFRSLLIQYAIFPLIKKDMIDPYYKEHPDEDRQQKMDLNIYEEPEEREEERVFEDSVDAEDDKQAPAIPRQYTEKEMDKIRELRRRNKNGGDDDDGTI